jgi:hypothetical protein
LTFYQGAVDCPDTEVLMLEKEPLDCVAARRMIRKILSSEEGQIVFSHHALKESMPDEGITEDEVVSCLYRGFCGPNITFERGTWRYPIETPGLAVVVAFDSEILAIVVTAWRRT